MIMSESTATGLPAQLAAIVAGIPPAIEQRIAAANDIVEAAGPHGIPIGSAAPMFSLPAADGSIVDLADRLAVGPVVLSFYRGEWCPFCNLELRALQAILPELTSLGASVLATSPQSPEHAEAVTAKHELGFDVLSDVDQAVIADYHLLYSIDGDARDLLENVFHNDISQRNADGTWRLPIPATFVLDRDGIVRDSYVNADYRTRMDPTEILAAVRRITADGTR